MEGGSGKAPVLRGAIRDNEAVPNRESSDWSNYYDAMLDKPLHPHYAKLDPHLPAGGEALDLGCGVGQGVVHLAEMGFHVTAVDGEQKALDHLQKRLPKNANVELVCSTFQDFEPGRYDVVVAHFSLFFLPRSDFEAFWPRLVAAVKPGGLLSMQFLGKNDQWADQCTTHTRQEVDQHLSPFEVLFLQEVEREGETAAGNPKHWHVFHVVARKK